VNPSDIEIADYNFDLPAEKIPDQPLAVRDASRLLVSTNEAICDHVFTDLPDILYSTDVLFMNNTRVIPARILFFRPTGARIEVFCLEPDGMEYQQSMQSQIAVSWICLVGGAKKWKEAELILEIAEAGHQSFYLRALKGEALGEGRYRISFEWNDPSLSFAEVLDRAGRIPIPPYFNREPEKEDLERYQTVFALHGGSVAAPTAGLHFTNELLQALASKSIASEYLTLHIGAGTFKPVSSITLSDHAMHGEWFEVTRELIVRLRDFQTGRRIAVGTTSLRTLESLYWLGVKVQSGQLVTGEYLMLGQWEYLTLPNQISLEQSMDALLNWMDGQDRKVLLANTSILIAPGYRFQVVQGLITNFHMPKSTLIVLVAALIGSRWRAIYNHALASGYRFLSYGDSSLLFP